MTVPLKDFDWILINTSAGKDSQTTLRYVDRMCREAGVDNKRIVAVHADLGKVEWPGCPDLAGKQVEHYGLRFEVRQRTGGDLLEYARRRAKWPSPRQRWCTSDFKRGPIRRLMTALTRETTWIDPFKRVRILNCMGMRAEESPARAKKQPFEFDLKASNSLREVWNWLPIHQWPVEEVWSDIRKSGIPYHYAYDLGMPRLSCSFCIFAPESALRLAGRHRPELLQEYVQIERETGHSFKNGLRLEDIQRQIMEQPDAEDSVQDWRM